MNDSLGEALSAREEALNRKAALEGLTNSPEWRRLVAFIVDQGARRVQMTMLTPVTNMEKAVEDAFTRGEYAGLHMVKKFIEDELTVATEATELFRTDTRNQTGE